jgi:hypothetical protein
LDTQLLSHALNDVVKTIVLPWLNLKARRQVTPENAATSPRGCCAVVARLLRGCCAVVASRV